MKLKSQAIALLGVFLCPLGLVWGEEQGLEILTRRRAIEIALGKHPSLKRAERTIAAAAARVKQAKSAYYPQIGAAGLAKQGLSGAAASGLGLKGLVASPLYRDLGSSGSVFQNLFDFGRTRHTLQAYQLIAESTRESAREQKAKVILDVEAAYYSTLQSQRLVQVGERTVEQRQRIARQAEVYYKAGLKSKLDAGLALINLSEAELDLVAARHALQNAFAQLNKAMGVHGPAHHNLEDPTIKVEAPRQFDELASLGLRNRPEILAIDVRIQALEEVVKRQESNLKPKLAAFWSSGWVRFSQLSLGRLMVGAFGFDLPIFTGGALKGQVEEAQAELGQAQAQREELAQDIRLEMERVYTGLIQEMETVKVSEQLVRQAQEAMRLAQVRYRVQLGSFLELAQAQLAVTNVETQYARALYNYKIAEAKLRYATGESSR
ncbi:MAG: TolC family protein [Acidobacteria bacterium]|nr:TolC family protein [Acidobacteriota bacterium]